MSNFINTVDMLGDEYVTRAILDRSISEYRDDTVTTVGEYAFYYCDKLTTVDFGSAIRIYDGAFNHCKSLKKVILRNPNELSVLLNTLVFNNTPLLDGKTGYIYVPRALVDEYRASTNWSNYSTQFRVLEDYTVDGTTTGELDITKI